MPPCASRRPQCIEIIFRRVTSRSVFLYPLCVFKAIQREVDLSHQITTLRLGQPRARRRNKLASEFSRPRAQQGSALSAPERVHLATATGTPDSSGSKLRLAHNCRLNAAFRFGARCNLVAVTRRAPLSSRSETPWWFV